MIAARGARHPGPAPDGAGTSGLTVSQAGALQQELRGMMADGPLRAALVIWTASTAAFTVSVYPVASSYAGVGADFELFDGLRIALLVMGGAWVPWAVSRLTWREHVGRVLFHGKVAEPPVVGALAKAGAAHVLVAVAMLLALPFVIVAYRTGTVSPHAAVAWITELTLFLSLVASLTLNCTVRTRRFMLSLAVAYGTMMAAAAGRIALGGWSGSGGTLIIAATLDALAIYALARRADNGPVYS